MDKFKINLFKTNLFKFLSLFNIIFQTEQNKTNTILHRNNQLKNLKIKIGTKNPHFHAPNTKYLVKYFMKIYTTITCQ